MCHTEGSETAPTDIWAERLAPGLAAMEIMKMMMMMGKG